MDSKLAAEHTSADPHQSAGAEPEALPTPAPKEPAAPASSGQSQQNAPSQRGTRNGLIVLALVLTAVSLLLPLGQHGIWDPYELDVAELSRRIALTLHGASDLVMEGADNRVPELGELGRGQLPFSSIAVGFQLFGLHDWAGRLPLALWGLLGSLAGFWLLSRLVDRVTGAYAMLILATTPLYFVQARTMLGDIVTMATVALAMAGLGLATFDNRRGITWTLAVAAGLLGLVCGFWSRGLLVGVAIPALGVGVAWLLSVLVGLRWGGFGSAAGAASLLIGTLALGSGGWAWATATPNEYSLLVGTTIKEPRELLTHDFMLQQIGHALVPWSAFLPLAVGICVRPTRDIREKETAARLLLLTTSIIGVAVFGFVINRTGSFAFAPIVALAGLIAVSFRDILRVGSSSLPALASVGGVLCILLVDFKNEPDKTLAAYSLASPKFPDDFENIAFKFVAYPLLAMVPFLLAALMERQPSSVAVSRPPEEGSAKLGPVRAWWLAFTQRIRSREWWLRESGLVADDYKKPFHLIAGESSRWLFVLLGVELLLVALWALKAGHLGDLASELLAAVEIKARTLGVLIVVLPAALAAPFAVLFVRDAFRVFFSLIPISRATFSLCAVVSAGLVLSLGYYPAFASQVSPKNVFSAFRSLAASGQPLAMVGGGTSSARYYARGDVNTFSSVKPAFEWLMVPDERRWLIVGAKDLGRVNSMFREQTTPPKNVPVLDAESSEVVLVSNRLLPTEKNQNPLNRWLLTERPQPHQRFSASFGKDLDVLGWEIADMNDQTMDTLEVGERYEFRIYYEVKDRVSGNWKTFIHLDGDGKRHNGDHETLDGEYPFNLWRKGDFIVDRHRFTLPSNFSGVRLSVHFGLFVGKKRKSVSRGAHKDDRFNAGYIQVR